MHLDISRNFVMAAVSLAALIHQGRSIQCYHCSNDFSIPRPYDPTCANPEYSNPDFIQELPDSDGCRTYVYVDGTVERGSSTGHDTSFCRVYLQHTYCFCAGDLCNNALCEDCDPRLR
ncbi:unnamed protein product [Meganyctiphanes norvegica]|uniref:Protein sleepless n=1 Tax=Meganyctiphanes norvegica TaxID=48144 RepID=A0AAV2QRC3_MEGNR